MGNIYDENEKKYSEVYKYEIVNFLNHLEQQLDLLLKNNIEITNKELLTLFITTWGCGLHSCEMKVLNNYIVELLENSKRDLVHGVDLNLSDEDKLFINKLLYDEIHSNQMTLLKLNLKEEDNRTKLLLYFKETDIDHYNNLIVSMKENYIKAVNLRFKLLNKQSKNNDTELSLHEALCQSYSIDRSEFLF